MSQGWGLSGDRVETMATSTGQTGIYWVAGVLGLLGATGGLAYMLLQGETADEAIGPVMPEAVILEDLATGSDAADADSNVTEPGPVVPDFSNFRLQNGLALMAGTAEPGATLEILLDAESIAQADVSSGGQYTAIFDIPAAAVPRVLSFAARLGDGDPVPGARTIIIQPFGMADPVAEAPASDGADPVDVAASAIDETPAPDAIALSDRAPDTVGDAEIPTDTPLNDPAPGLVGASENPVEAEPAEIALSEPAPGTVGDTELPTESVAEAPDVAQRDTTGLQTALSERAPDTIGDVEPPTVTDTALSEADTATGDGELLVDTAPERSGIALSERAPDTIGDVEPPTVSDTALSEADTDGELLVDTAPESEITLSDRAPDRYCAERGGHRDRRWRTAIPLRSRRLPE